MFTALALMGMSLYGKIEDERKKKKDEEKKQDKEWMYQQRERNELGADYFERQGWHPPKESEIPTL